MDLGHFTFLLANPQRITEGDVRALEHLIQKYPYFQSARALQLRGLKNQDSYKYNDALRLTAAHTADRDILFEYITSEKFVQNEISKTILQQDDSVKDIPVISEDVSARVKAEKEQFFIKEQQKAEAILNPELFQRKVNSIANIVSKTVPKEDAPPPKTHERPVEAIDPERPLEFTKNDTYSFSEWLKLTKAKPIVREKEKESISEVSSETDTEAGKKERKFELIDKFIQERPKITPSIEGEKSPEKVKVTSSPDPSPFVAQSSEPLMTETLARVYLQQKNYKKAIQAYKILILKNPEKSGFFADQIRAIEKLTNTEEQ